MGTYDLQIGVAASLIRQQGKQVLLVRHVNASPDPNQPWNTDTTSTVTESVYAVFLNLNIKDAETQSYMKGTEILAGDRKVLIAGNATNAPPSLKDELLDGSVRWSIESVQELAPNGEQILYTLRVRR